MAGKITTDTEALEQAAAALGKYIEGVSVDIRKMKDAARDCSDNMGSDVYSAKAIQKLEECARKLSVTIRNAEDLRRRILQKKQAIEDSGTNF